MSAGWRTSTKKQYLVYIRKWKVFCGERHLIWTHTKVGDLFKFFNMLYKTGASYSALNTARSALASVVILDDERYTITTHPWIIRYFRGVFNLRTPVPRYSFIWDVGKVLDYLRGLTPAHRLNLKQLTLKVCTLLALVTAQRIQTLSLLSIDNVRITIDRVEIAVTELLKQSRPGNIGTKLTLRALPGDKKLCIVHYLREYVNRTKPLRFLEKGLLLCYNQPHKKASKQTVARWIKVVLKNSGIDTEQFKAHSTRSAATSMAKKNNFPLTDILKQAGWKTETTFIKFYLKPTNDDSSFGNNVLHGNSKTKSGQ